MAIRTAKQDTGAKLRFGDMLWAAADVRMLGSMVDRTHRELTDDDLVKIAGTYNTWRGVKGAGEYTQLEQDA